jgi:hypothetical protein
LPLSKKRSSALSELPPVPVTGVFFRQTSLHRKPLVLPATAPRDARWHRKGDPWPAYAGDTELGSMLELTRYVDAGSPPLLPRRLMSDLHLDGLPLIDLVNPLALAQLDIVAADLTRGIGPDKEAEICREIADEVRRRTDVHGLLVPSAAITGGRTLVLYPTGFGEVTVGDTYRVELAVLRIPVEDDA